MPKKNVWTYRKRRKTKKGKKGTGQETERANSGVSDPDDSSISVMSEMPPPNDKPLKKEDIIYPDTRFQRSTTLFPAKLVENITPSEKSSETFKRSPENIAFGTPPKKCRLNDSTISEECVIVENPKQLVKVELVDLTDDSHGTTLMECSPVKTSYLENRLPGKIKATLLANGGNVRVKVEPNEKKCEVNTDIGAATDMNFQAIVANAEQNRGKENSNEVNMSNVDLNKNTDNLVDTFPQNQVKTEKSVQSESNSKVNFNAGTIEPLLDNQIQVKAEQCKSNESNSEKSRVAVCKLAETTTDAIHLSSELDKENDNIDEVPVLNSVSVCNAKNVTEAKTSDGHLFNHLPIKMEQNENCVDTDNSTLVSNISYDVNSTGINSADSPLRSEENNTNENCGFSSPCCTKEKFKNLVTNCSVDNEEVLENLICESTNSTQKSTNSNNKSTIVTSSEKLITDEINRVNISSVTDDDNFDEGDSHLYEPGPFETPLLKYLNCNTKVGVLQLSDALSSLNIFLKGEEEISVIGSEVIPNSQDKWKLSLAEKSERLPNSEVDEILRKLASLPDLKELMNLSSKRTNITNLASNSVSQQVEKSRMERQVENSLNSGKKQPNNSPNNLFESSLKMSESSGLTDCYSHITYDSPMNNESPFKDNCLSVSSMSSLEENEQSTTNNLSVEVKKNVNEKYSTDYFRKILSNVKSTEKSNDIAEISSTFNSSVDPVKSDIFIDESVFKTLREIRLPQNKQAKNMNSTSDINKRNSELNIKDSEDAPKSLYVPNESCKRTRGALFNPSTTYDDGFDNRPKRNKIGLEEYKKRDTSQHPQDHYRDKYLPSNFPSNSFDSSLGSSNFEQNMSPSGNRQNRSLLLGSNTNLQNLGHRHMVNATRLQDPRLVRTLHKDLNSSKQLGSYDSQSFSGATKSFIPPHGRQASPISTFYTVQNSNTNEPSRLTENVVKNQQVKNLRSEINSFHRPDFNLRAPQKNCRGLLPSPVSESSSFSLNQHNPHQSAQGLKGRQHLSHVPVNASSPPSELHHLVSHVSKHSAHIHDYHSSESVNREYNPPLPLYNPPPPPLPPTSPIVDQSHFIASNHSPSSLFHNFKKHANQPSSGFIFVSLLPRQLSEDVGRNIINTEDVYLIIIERNIDWILGIDKEIIPRISETGCEFQQVRNNYANHLMHYNTYFPLLLLDCFSRISNGLKGAKAKEKIDKNLCKVIKCETKQKYVSFTCDSFIRHSEVDSIPKEGHIVLVRFATEPEGSVRMLGYVCTSGTRAYSHKHDHAHEILKYMNVTSTTDLIKVKIQFDIVFGIPGIKLNYPILISKLTSIKKALTLNDALKELPRSPLCDAVFNPRKHIKSFSLPRRQDTTAMTAVVKGIVQSLNHFAPMLAIVKTAPFTDPFLAIVQIVEEIQKYKIPGKVLVCVRTEMLSQMGMNLLETSSNLIIINREREILHEKLQSRVLDGMVTNLLKSQNISDTMAKIKVLEEAEVLLVVTGTCFYEDVQSLAKDLTYCIIHDAHHFTEPESLLPLLYGIRHLLLFGDPEESCHVSSKCAANLGYNKSLFHRIYNLC